MSFCKRGVRGKRGLAGGDDEHLARESGGAVLGDELDLLGDLVVVVDELLHLVQDDERQRQLPVGVALQLQDVFEGVEHVGVDRCRRPSGTASGGPR